MALAQQQGERWATQNVILEGGLYLDKDAVFQAAQMPGSAIKLTNFEPSLDGGYHRILGYQKYDTHQLPHGASQIFGVIVSHFETSVIAMQAGDTYRSSGSGWTKISGTDNHSGMGHVEHTDYTWATSRFTFVDGDPAAHPVRIEAGGTYTVLTNAPTGQKFIREFNGYLWMSSGDSNITFSAPQNDNDYNAGDGAGQINVGFSVVGLGVWRGALYVFGGQRIAQITGTSAADWQVTILTDQIGMTGPYSLQEVNGDLVFMSSDGIRTISGTARIFDRELGVISRAINTLIIPMGGTNLTSCVIKTKSQYRLFQATSSTDQITAPGIIGTLKLQTNGSVAWEWSTTLGIKAACADSGTYGTDELTVHGAWDGYVYKQESGIDFDGTNIQATYQTPYLIYSDSAVRKILYKMLADFRATGVTNINLGTQFDYSDTNILNPPDQVISLNSGVLDWDNMINNWGDAGIFWGLQPLSRAKVNLIGSCFSSSFIFYSNGGSDYSLQAYSVTYGQAARR
jgi:hypothetical protein